MNNKYSVLAKFEESSVQAQDMLQSLSQNVPQLDKLLNEIDQFSQNGEKYIDNPALFDVDLPMICSYLTFWWNLGPDGPHSPEKGTDQAFGK